MRRCMCRAWMLVALVAALPLAGRAATGAETFVRCLAKSPKDVYIIVSGPDAEDVAKVLQSAILQHPDRGAKAANDVPILTIAEAEQRRAADAEAPKRKGGRFGECSLVFMFSLSDHPASLPPGLAALAPGTLGEASRRVSSLRSSQTQKADAGLAYSVCMVAPDRKRLAGLLQAFTSHSAGHYSALPFSADFPSNNVAVFSSDEHRSAAEGWGRSLAASVGAKSWDSIVWRPLAERAKMKDEELADCDQAYFIDRSLPPAELPDSVAQLSGAQPPKETATLVLRRALPGGNQIALVSTPTAALLEARLKKYPRFDAIPASPVVDDVKDLRHIGRTTLLVSGSGPTSDERETIRLQLAKDMREKLRVPVEERGDVLRLLEREVTLQELQGASDTAELLRSKARLRFVWLFTVTDYRGSTDYKSAVRVLSTDAPPTYDEAHGSDDPEPTYYHALPWSGQAKKDREKRERAEWEPKHAAWLRRKALYDDQVRANFTSQWERVVSRQTSAAVRGMLRLVDLKPNSGAVEVIWEKEAGGSSSSPEESHQSDTVTVRGVGMRPSSLTTPPRQDSCPRELMLAAARSAGASALSELQATALLPDGSAPPEPEPPAPVEEEKKEPSPPKEEAKPVPPASDDAAATPTPTPQTKGPVVADVDTANAAIVVALAPGDKVRVGDSAYVLVEKKITNPQSGEVLEVRAAALVKLRVVRVSEKTADCVPSVPDGRAKLASVKAGMAVKWEAAPKPKPATPSGNGRRQRRTR